MKKILFVCTGNTCRSPMAAAFFNRLAGLEPSNFDYEAVSAGLAVSKDAPASKNAVLAMRDSWNLDISNHRSKILSRSDVDEAYLLLTMTQSQKHYISSMFPDAYQKVHALKEYVYDEPDDAQYDNGSTSPVIDISDPYGGSLWDYKLCAAEIGQAVDKLIGKLKKS